MKNVKRIDGGGRARIGIEEFRSLAECLSKQVLLNIAGLDARRVLKGQTVSRRRVRAPARRVDFYGDQPIRGGLLGHRHGHVELATTVKGRLVVGIDRQIYRSDVGDWILCPPNVLHGEARRTPRGAYELLWFLERNGALALHLSCYVFRRGYFTRGYILLGPMPEEVRRTFHDICAEGAVEPARLRLLLLRLVAWCIEQLARRQPAETPRPHPLIKVVRDLLADSPIHPPSVPELARRAGLSSNYLSSLFHRECGMTLRRYVESRRIERACGFLRQSRHPVKEIAYALGFADPPHFSHAFRRVMGMSPLAYRGRVSEFETRNR